MRVLSKDLLNSGFLFSEDLETPKYPGTLPERVIQFGEGNFLRAFADWMIHKLNQNNLFNGQVVIVQPIKEGLSEVINEQDGLYTLLLRGLENDRATERKEIISAVSRCLNPYVQWDECLKCAEDPLIEYVISNTTEAGIIFDQADSLNEPPPFTFPGKLTAYLFHRFQHFGGDAAKGMTVIPCELIEKNGDNLRKTVLKYAEAWRLPEAFGRWVEESNYFLNTLVDRVVTGYPKDEMENITQALGYKDALVDAGELFHLWVIEGPPELSEKLPFDKVGLNVIWTNDMTPYRTRKVRILNGAHTSSVPAAFLYGLDTVGEMMEHEVLGKYVRQVIYEEIVPSIKITGLTENTLKEFAKDVIERFKNPFIKHYLLSILLNSSSKFKARVLPSILEYLELHKTLPPKLLFSFAALIAVYKNGEIAGEIMRAARDKDNFIMKDDLWVLEFFAEVWTNFDGSRKSTQEVVEKVLKNEKLWGQDLSAIEGLANGVGEYLHQITTQGIQKTIAALVEN